MDKLRDETDIEVFLRSKGKSVVFVHTQGAVEELKEYKELLGDCVVIPTSPEANFVLDELNISYRIPEDYYSEEENYAYTSGLKGNIFGIVDSLDRELSSRFMEIRDNGLELARYSLNNFVVSYTVLANTCFKIDKIVNAEKPVRVGYFGAGNARSHTAPFISEGFLWDPQVNIFEKLLPLYGKRRGVSVKRISTSGRSEAIPAGPQVIPPEPIRTWIRKNPRLYYLSDRFRAEGASGALRLLGRQLRSKPLALLYSGYGWDLSHDALYEKGYAIWGQINSDIGDVHQGNGGKYEKVLDVLYDSAPFREYFKEGGIDLYPLLEGRIRYFLSNIVPASLRAYERASHIFRRKKFYGALNAVKSTSIAKSIAKAAQDASVPVIGWQHGDLNYRPIYSFVFDDLLVTDFFLNWGESNNKLMTDMAQEIGLRTKQMPVGSASLDNIRCSAGRNLREGVLSSLGLEDRGNVIVYATTMYYLSHAANFNKVPWSDNHIYEGQKTILDNLEMIKATKIAKLHPTLVYIVSQLDTYCRERGVMPVRYEYSAQDLFPIADAIIVDMPSTTLLEAVATKAAVFCLTRNTGITEEAEELLRKRAVCASDAKVLMDKVEEFSRSGRYEADVSNDEFLEAYGTFLDCKASERAAEAVDDAINSKF